MFVNCIVSDLNHLESPNVGSWQLFGSETVDQVLILSQVKHIKVDDFLVYSGHEIEILLASMYLQESLPFILDLIEDEIRRKVPS